MKSLRIFATSVLAAFAMTALPALAHNVLIVNPLPNRVWVTVRANGSNIWSGWVAHELRYETRQASPTFRAEIARLHDNSVHPQIICDTSTNFSSSDRRTRITIRLDPQSNRCWWESR